MWRWWWKSLEKECNSLYVLNKWRKEFSGKYKFNSIKWAEINRTEFYNDKSIKWKYFEEEKLVFSL